MFPRKVQIDDFLIGSIVRKKINVQRVQLRLRCKMSVNAIKIKYLVRVENEIEIIFREIPSSFSSPNAISMTKSAIEFIPMSICNSTRMC